MSKRLNLASALGIFLIGLFSANVSQAQITNVYWKPSTGLGGGGTWNSANAFWSTNSDGSGTLSSPTTLGTNTIYNFSGTAGLVNETSSFTLAGINWLTTGYTWSSGANRTLTGIDQTSTGTNTIFIANNANLNITGTGFTFDAMSMTGGAGSTVTLTNAAGATTTVIFGTSSARGGRTNSVNTIISGAGTIVLGSQANGTGFTQAGNIINNSTGTFVLTNSTSGTVTVSGAISGSGALTLANAGTGNVELTSANSYSGGTIIQHPTGNTSGAGWVGIYNSSAFGSGTVTIAGAGTNYIRSMASSLNITNAITMNSGSTLRLANSTSGATNTVSGLVSGAGGIVYTFTDVQRLLNTNNSFGGGVNIASSTEVQVNNIGGSGSNSSLGTNGVVTFSSISGSGGAGTLRWLGTSSENSDKSFALNTISSSASAGMRIYAGDSNSVGSNLTLTLNGNINSTGFSQAVVNTTNVVGGVTNITSVTNKQNMTITLGAFNTNTLVMNGTINQTAGFTNSLVVGNSGVGTVVLGSTNNSFGGSLTINAGSSSTNTVQVARVGNAGENSSLGTNGSINIGGSSSSGVNILKYVGSGETNNKVINLAGTTGGATLDQSGTGNLRFSSAMTATGVGAKTITLTGSTAGTGELAGGISDIGGNVISLNKNGSGDWILSGNNNYSGLTTIKDAGSLLKLMATNALSANTSLAGENTLAAAGTIEFGVGGSYTANSYGTLSTSGNNMYFTNSSGNAVTLTFTNANNYITGSTGGGRTLSNSSSNLNLDFDGNIEIGSTATNTTVFRGAGSFNVDGNLLDTGAGGIRALEKDGDGTLTLRGSGNNYRGSTLVDSGKLDLYGSVTASTNIVVSTSGAVSAASTTRTATATLDVKSGGSLLANSTTTVNSGGNLIVNGTAGAVVMESNGLLGGSGTVGAVTLKSGSLLSPGNSPGTLTAASSSWAAGSTYQWQIDDATGSAGTNWDLFSVTGALDLSALSSSGQMNLVLESLSIANFSTTSSYTWVIAQAGSFTGTGLADGTNVTSLFNIDAADFNSGVGPANGWKVEVGSANGLRTLNLMAIPEPSTGSMLGLGLVGLVVTRLLRRKNS
jgi:autotransporter-associated beta strand protein